MYSALSAYCVEDPEDPNANLNTHLLIKLQNSDRVSYCYNK